MKRKKNKTTKVAVISTIIVVVLVGISVFSLHSLSEKNADSSRLSAVNDTDETLSSSKLLSRVDEETEFIFVPASEEVKAEEPVVVVPQITAEEAAASAPVVDIDIVVNDSVVYVPQEEPVYEEPVYEEPVTEAPVYEEPVYEVIYDDYTYEEPVYFGDDQESYEEPVYEEPQELVVYDSTVDDNVGYYEEGSWEDESYYEETWEDESYYEEESWEDESYYEETWEDESYYEEESWEDESYEEEYYEPEEYVASNASLGEQIAGYASGFVGVTPYVWAGRSLVTGTDCSGFTNLIYGDFGIYVPTGSDAYQYGVGVQVSYDQLLQGDIVVYRYGGHVAIYAGNDTIIHCANEDAGTIYSSMWYDNPTAYVRVVY